MRLKTELYVKEQDEVINKLITILDLENKNTYTLYELDNNIEIQNQIIELTPEIKKWFSYNNIKAVGQPKRIKRPWLSIIKSLLKQKYNIESKGYHFKLQDKWLMTQQYLFTKI